MNQRGKVQFLTIVLILAIAGAAWAAVIYGPYYLDHSTVKQTTQQYLSRMTSVNKRGDVDLRKLYIAELNRIGQHDETDATGLKKVVKGLGITDEMVTWKTDNVTGISTVGVEYSRTFQLKPLKKWKTLQFSVFKEQGAGQ